MKWGVVLKCGDTTEWVIRKRFLRYFLIMHEYTERTLPCKTVQSCYGGSVSLLLNGFCLFTGADCRGLLLRVLNETHRTSNMVSICYIVLRFIGYCCRNFTDLAVSCATFSIRVCILIFCGDIAGRVGTFIVRSIAVSVITLCTITKRCSV